MKLKNTNFFDSFYQRYLRKIMHGLENIKEKFDIEISFPSVYNGFGDELVKMSYQMLIFELNYFREMGKLNGKTSEERYESFCKVVGTEEFHKYISLQYPVFEYLVEEKIQHVLKCIQLIVSSFFTDRKELETVFSKKFNKIDDIELECGDTHDCGSTIAILTGDFGKIVYKSRNLYNDLALNEMVDFLDQRGNLRYALKKNCVLSRENYGWQEFIENTDCSKLEDVGKYYYRLGVYLAVFFILNSGDMHYENIICEGEYPRIIDTETLVTVSKYKNLPVHNELHNYPMDNVLSTSLLPINNKNGFLDVDMSGISGGDFKSQKIKEYYIENYGTDQMRVTRRNLEHKMKQTNIPQIDGEQIVVSEWRTDLLEGFEDAMFIFYDNKAELKEYVLSSHLKFSHQRQLFRNTFVYAKFLEASVNPKYLENFEKRRDLFNNLVGRENQNSKLISHEISVLNKGYIPAYYSEFDSHALFSNGELIQDGFFNQSGKNTVIYKISTLSPETIRLQKHIINLSYMTLVKEIISKPDISNTNKGCYKNCMEGASLIFRDIGKNTLVNPENGKTDLYVIRLGEKTQSLQGLDLSLYEGGGLIWAMYCFAKEVNNQKLLECSLAWAQAAEEKQCLYKVNESLSLFGGIGSVLFIFFNLYRDTRDEKMYFIFKNYLLQLSNRMGEMESIDYMHGVSGYIVMLAKIMEKDDNMDVADTFAKAKRVFLDKLINYSMEDAGIAHGGSGVALALSVLFSKCQDNNYLRKIDEILQEEKEILDYENKFWCRGFAGITLAKAEILKNIKAAYRTQYYMKLQKELNKDVEYLLDFEFNETDNLCLCHGIYGYCETINNLYKNFQDLMEPCVISKLQNKIKALKCKLPIINADGLWLTTDYILETFMLGSSGAAYAMLRLQNNRYPSILSLEMI